MNYNKCKVLDIGWMGDDLNPYQFTVKVELMSPDSPRPKHITLSIGDFPDERTVKEAVESYIERERQSDLNQARMKSLLGKVIDL